MHRLLTLVCYRRGVEVEDHGGLPWGIVDAVRRQSVHSKIAGVESIRIHRNAHVDSEVSRLSKYHTVTGRVSATHRQSRQLAVCEGILLGSAADGHSRSEEHTSELQSLAYLVCRLLLEK